MTYKDPTASTRISPVEPQVVALLVVAFYHPLLRLGAMQSGGDAANLFWPIKLLIQESFLRDHVVPLWNPWSFLGAPLVASLQHAVFYPPDWVLYSLLPAHWAMNIGNLLHLVSAGVGTWWWLRWGLRTEACPAVIAGAAFPCAAWFWGQQEHINQLAAASYLPWLVVLIWGLLQDRLSVVRFGLLYSGIACLQFMTGHPQEAFYGHLCAGLLALGKLAVGPERGVVLKRLVGAGAMTGALAGLLVAVQLLPTLELNGHSRRQFADPTYAISFSMPPDLLKTYVSPHHFGSFRDGYFARDADGNPLPDEAGNPQWDRRAYGEYGLFVGVPMLLLAAIGLAVERRRRLAWGLLLIGFCALLLALGGNTDPHRLLTRNFTEFPEPGGWSLHEIFLRLVPPARGFRVPARVVVLTAFALVTLGAFGIAALSRRGRGVAVVLGVAVLASLYLPSRREKFHWPVEMKPTLDALAIQSLDMPAWTLDNRLFRLTLEDDTRLIDERHREATFRLGNPIERRFLAMQPHMNAPLRVAEVDGYEEGLVPTARYKDFLHAFSRNFRTSRPDQDLLNLLGVSQVYSDLPIDTSVYPSVAKLPQGLGALYENRSARGAAFWMADVEGVDLAAVDGPWWRGGEPLAGYLTVRSEFGGLARWGSAGPKLKTTLPTVNRVEVTAEPGTLPPGDALLSMSAYPGWRIEGEAEPLEFLSAVHGRLPRPADGTAHWSLRFEPFSYRLGLFLTALGLGLWVAVWRGSRGRHYPATLESCGTNSP